MLSENPPLVAFRMNHNRKKLSEKPIGWLLDLLESFDIYSEFGNPLNIVAKVPKNDGGFEYLPLGSEQFCGRILLMTYMEHGEPPSLADVKLACKLTAARAQLEKHPKYFFIRIGSSGYSLYLDLADDSGKAVEIDANGWRIVDNAPVVFLQTPGMLPLPKPTPGSGNINLLKKFVRVSNNQWPLIPAWLVNIFRIRGPHVILANVSFHGTGKTLGSRCMRHAVDPNRVPLRSEARSERDLVITASKSLIAAFDNISHLTDPMSEALCRLTTTGGFSTRKLYYDHDGNLIDLADTTQDRFDVPDFVARLLASPRSLRTTLRRVLHSWARLRGEVDILDLMMVIA